MLIFQIKKIISSENWFHYVVTLFFFENAKNLGRSDDAKRRKKRGWPNQSNLMIRGMTDKQLQHVSRSFGLFISEIRRSRKKLTAGTFDWNFSRYV